MRRISQITRLAPHLLDAGELLSVWNESQPDDLHASARLFAWWQAVCESGLAEGAVLQLHRSGTLAGVSFVSHLPPSTGAEAPEHVGWLDALVAAKSGQQGRDRARLLNAAEKQLSAWGCSAMVYGGGPLSLVRGVAEGERAASSAARDGFAEPGAPNVFDMVADVARYRPPDETPAVAGVVRPAQPRDRDEIDRLLAGPLFAVPSGAPAGVAPLLTVRHLLAAGRISDLMLLWTDDGVVGLVQVAYGDSVWPVELAYPWALPRPWAALPALLTRPALADAASLALLDSALRRLHNTGVNSCIVPGVARTVLYQRAGFVRARSWRPLHKRLDGAARR